MAPTSPLSGYEKQMPTKNFDLAPLAPPDLGSSRYNVVGGYTAYLADYKAYRTELSDMTEHFLMKKVEKKKTSIVVQDHSTAVGVNYTGIPGKHYGMFWDFNNSAKVLQANLVTNAGLSVLWTRALMNGVYACANLKENLGKTDFVYTWTAMMPHVSGVPQKATHSSTFRPMHATATGPVRMPKPQKEKAPAPIKKEKSEEQKKAIADRAAKREATSVWFREKSLELKKCKLEEKLAQSASVRSKLISSADKSVDTSVDIDGGWRVVTRPRKTKKKVVDIVKSKTGKKVTKSVNFV